MATACEPVVSADFLSDALVCCRSNQVTAGTRRICIKLKITKPRRFTQSHEELQLMLPDAIFGEISNHLSCRSRI